MQAATRACPLGAVPTAVRRARAASRLGWERRGRERRRQQQLHLAAELERALGPGGRRPGGSRRWWRAFGVAASGSAYMFAYALVYFYTRLHLTKFASVVLYFGSALGDGAATAVGEGQTGPKCALW